MSSYSAEISTVQQGDRTQALPADPNDLHVSHHLADEAGIRVETLSGGHLLHLAVAGCVFNTVLRAARARNVALRQCRVAVQGGFDAAAPRSTGITYEIELDGDASSDELTAIAREADAESTIPNLLREATTVLLQRIGVGRFER